MDNRALFEHLFDSLNDREWGFLEAHVADDVIVHDSETNAEYRGFTAFKDLTEDFFSDYPDAQISVREITRSGNHLAALVEITGTPAEPTAEAEMELEGMIHCRIENGEFAEIWTLTD